MKRILFLSLCLSILLNSCQLPNYTELKKLLNQTSWVGQSAGSFIAVCFGYGTMAVAIASSENEALSKASKTAETEYRITDIDDTELSAVLDVSGYGYTRIKFEYNPHRSRIEIYTSKSSSILAYDSYLRKYVSHAI